MMVGMMLPSAMPMILLFTTIQRTQGKQPVVTTGTFAAGYLLIWGGFAVAAAALQIELEEFALLSPSLTVVSTRLSGMAFLLAAAYECSPSSTVAWRSAAAPSASSPPTGNLASPGLFGWVCGTGCFVLAVVGH